MVGPDDVSLDNRGRFRERGGTATQTKRNRKGLRAGLPRDNGFRAGGCVGGGEKRGAGMERRLLVIGGDGVLARLSEDDDLRARHCVGRVEGRGARTERRLLVLGGDGLLAGLPGDDDLRARHCVGRFEGRGVRMERRLLVLGGDGLPTGPSGDDDLAGSCVGGGEGRGVGTELFTVRRRFVRLGKGHHLGAGVVREVSEVRALSERTGEESTTAGGSLWVMVAEVLDGSVDTARRISSGAGGFIRKSRVRNLKFTYCMSSLPIDTTSPLKPGIDRQGMFESHHTPRCGVCSRSGLS